VLDVERSFDGCVVRRLAYATAWGTTTLQMTTPATKS